MCQDILDHGFSTEGMPVRPHWEDGTPAHTIKNFGVVNRYDLSEEFPALTLRPTAIKLATDEMLWIWQKKSNRLADLKSHVWDEWADEEGTIGKAYGYQMAKKYKFKQGEMDQVDNVLWCLKNDRYSRRILTNLYNFEDLSEMRLNWNVVQYAMLLMMMAQVSGLKAGELVHVISDAHIYDRHVDIIKELIARPQYPAPKVTLNPDVKNFYDFTTDDIKVENYQHGEQIRNIPVAI